MRLLSPFIAANVALLFSLAMVLRAACLSEDGIDQTEPWLILQPQERPAGDIGRRLARDDLRVLPLRFAKTAAAVAMVLYGCSLVVSLNAQSRSLHVLVSEARS